MICPTMHLGRFVIISLFLIATPLRAEIRPEQAAAEIDALLDAHWKTAGVAANEPISDETFLRRIYLDLAGRIPTSTEAHAFLSSTHRDKRSALIEELLGRESYVSNFYNFWADILRLKSHFVNTANVVPAAFAKFVKESLRTNKRYDQFVRELLSAKGLAWDNGAVGYYLRDPEMPLDNMALTARIFLGTRIECAQCHDHPFDKWKQTEFYHLAAYTFGNKPVHEAFEGPRAEIRARQDAIQADFKKEKAVASDGGQAAEQRKNDRLKALGYPRIIYVIKNQVGQLLSPCGLERRRDKVLKLPFDFRESDGQPGDAMSPRPLFGHAPELSPGDDAGDVFARWVTSPENPTFTKVIVNRLWKRMFGVALYEPLDDLRDDSQAMIPTVEAYLEKLMVALNYDMRSFLAVIARTRVYQSAVVRDEFVRGETYHFQGPTLRRMTAEQIWDSVVALANHEPDARDLQREASHDRRIGISHMVYDAYMNYDSGKLVEMAYERLQAATDLDQRQAVVKEAQVLAHRAGDQAKLLELRRRDGDLIRERNEGLINDFIMPLLSNLARIKVGSDATPVVDETYKMNSNPSVLQVETWRKMHIAGYGPPPQTEVQLAANAEVEQQYFRSLATKLGFAEYDSAAFVSYCRQANRDWLRASELDSPAPRGHFLRTMGQSDRDFVENANPNASIPQALALMNSNLVSNEGLLSRFSPLMVAVHRPSGDIDPVDAAFLAVLSRKPTASEKTIWSATGKNVEALVYTLINTKQFLFIQ